MVAFFGVAFGGVGLFLGIAMSSAISGTPFMYGSVAAIYTAVSVAVLTGVKQKGSGLSSN